MRSMPITRIPSVVKRLVALASRRCRGPGRLRRLEVAFLAVVFFTVAFFAVAFLAGPIPRSLPLLFDQITLSPGHRSSGQGERTQASILLIAQAPPSLRSL